LLRISLYIIYVIRWLVTYDVTQDSHIRWREVLRQCMYGDSKLKLLYLFLFYYLNISLNISIDYNNEM